MTVNEILDALWTEMGSAYTDYMKASSDVTVSYTEGIIDGLAIAISIIDPNIKTVADVLMKANISYNTQKESKGNG